MKTLAITGWVAATAAILVAAVLLARPPVVVEVPVTAPVPPFVAEGHPELRGIRTVGVIVSGKGVPEDVTRRVGEELRAAGLTVVDEPPDGQMADREINATFNLTLRVAAEFGPEATKAAMGHAHLDTQSLYGTHDLELAKQVARKVG